MILHGDCIEKMKGLEENSIDLTVTSPPYDNLRNYNGSLDWSEKVWKEAIRLLYKVTKDGGVVVWVVGDATIKGSETGTSFKQALWAIECGFNLHDTMIWNKGTFTAVGSLKTRYAPVFEYMFIFSNGRPKTFNPIKDRINKVMAENTMEQSDKKTGAHDRWQISVKRFHNADKGLIYGNVLLRKVIQNDSTQLCFQRN